MSVEVVIASLAQGPTGMVEKLERKGSYQTMVATCIISSWSIDDAQFFTLTFTSATAAEPAHNTQPSSRIVNRTNTVAQLRKSRSSGSSSSSGHRSGSNSNSASRTATPNLQPAEFPPRGPPSRVYNNVSTSVSVFQKATQLKDAILNAINMPAYGS